jgi:rubrerythrin
MDSCFSTNFDNNELLKINGNISLGIIIKNKLIEELAAINSYTSLIEKLNKSDNLKDDIRDKIIKEINEIRKDERNHTGRLLGILKILNKTEFDTINKGMNFEE